MIAHLHALNVLGKIKKFKNANKFLVVANIHIGNNISIFE